MSPSCPQQGKLIGVIAVGVMLSPIMPEQLAEAEEAEIAVACRGAPAWITPEVVRETIDVWRPLYAAKGQAVTVSDAIEICINVAGVLRVLFLSTQEQAPQAPPPEPPGRSSGRGCSKRTP